MSEHAFMTRTKSNHQSEKNDVIFFLGLSETTTDKSAQTLKPSLHSLTPTVSKS